MKYTKEELDQFKNDPFMRFVAGLFGTDINEIVEDAKKELDEEEKKNKINEVVNECKKYASGRSDKNENAESRLKETLRKMEEDGLINNLRVDDKLVQSQKKEYDSPKASVSNFIMSKKQFTDFVKKYTELVNSASKLSYLYGISFDNAGSQFNFTNAVTTIIWDFVRIIFGDDNADDIADFIYGNSNFDSAEQLYEELL